MAYTSNLRQQGPSAAKASAAYQSGKKSISSHGALANNTTQPTVNTTRSTTTVAPNWTSGSNKSNTATANAYASVYRGMASNTGKKAKKARPTIK